MIEIIDLEDECDGDDMHEVALKAFVEDIVPRSCRPYTTLTELSLRHGPSFWSARRNRPRKIPSIVIRTMLQQNIGGGPCHAALHRFDAPARGLGEGLPTGVPQPPHRPSKVFRAGSGHSMRHSPKSTLPLLLAFLRLEEGEKSLSCEGEVLQVRGGVPSPRSP
jgi:hypothetical protein